MKKILVLALVLTTGTLFAQQTSPAPKKQKIDLSNRPGDHLMLQLGTTSWSGVPDTINMGGLSKSLNVYVMFDYPFKSNPKLSSAIGIGLGSDHIGFSKTNLKIAELYKLLQFTNVRDTNHFKKTVLSTTYLEAPVELRYTANPETGKGFKFAIGVKVGTMLNAHTRNTKWENRDGTLLNNYVMKESSKHYFNTTRVTGTIRAGIGHVSVFANYQFSSVIKEGYGPQVKPFSIGVALSGL